MANNSVLSNNKSSGSGPTAGAIIAGIIIVGAIIAFVGFLIANHPGFGYPGGSYGSSSGSGHSGSSTKLTESQAQSLVGKTVSYVCSNYGLHNIHIRVYMDDGTYSGAPCDDYYPFGNAVIIRAYYDDEDDYYDTPEEYRKPERRVYFDAEER